MLFKNALAIMAVAIVNMAAAQAEAVDAVAEQPCGFKLAPCPEGTVCIPKYPKLCNEPKKCRGVCTPFISI